ncbi:hypothetical protein cce_4779 [Crocosphaera subtropica ATCC 51142]|uniref:Uncharacterized protein n=1 Tax=Crocosphaera subtropica (strain ATCC 51142 / BH68) TaxID=43989 RepID=B1X1W6_CROS5|nr:hypothetical protein cce_4779 [Crocosphaera subtropica ATCC 51142]
MDTLSPWLSGWANFGCILLLLFGGLTAQKDE